MSVLTTAGKNQLLDKVDGDTGALTWYLAPFNGDPSGAGSEVSATTSEGRTQLTSSNMAAAASGSVASSADITWTATGSITVDYIAIYDAASSGNLVGYDAITSKSLANTETITIPTGSLTISLTDS
jgi:hypothetical protein